MSEKLERQLRSEICVCGEQHDLSVRLALGRGRYSLPRCGHEEKKSHVLEVSSFPGLPSSLRRISASTLLSRKWPGLKAPMPLVLMACLLLA